jgi:hypothetical protein
MVVQVERLRIHNLVARNTHFDALGTGSSSCGRGCSNSDLGRWGADVIALGGVERVYGLSGGSHFRADILALAQVEVAKWRSMHSRVGCDRGGCKSDSRLSETGNRALATTSKVLS